MNLQNTASQADLDIFEPPLFSDPSSRALSRVGVVDVGSNSVRMVVFDGAARSPAYFYNEKIMCGLGAGLSETGRLNPEGRKRALGALRRFQAIANGMGLPPLSTVATAAVRDASDGDDFCAEVKAETGMTLRVINGADRHACLPRACCWAGPAPTGWSAILAARRWSWRRLPMARWASA